MITLHAVLYVHWVTLGISVGLFVLRYWWLHTGSPIMHKGWVRIVPHVNDTVLLLSGCSLMLMLRVWPFTAQGLWLTEKLFGVIIYIALGFIALGRGSRNPQIRWFAFLLALVVLYVIFRVATTQVPLLGIL